MGPLPYPHRVTFLASTLHVPAEFASAHPYVARLLSVMLFDHLLRHPVVTLGDHDDERLIDEAGQLLDANHPQIEDSIDWFFRISRRREVLWLEVSLDSRHAAAPVLRSRRPNGALDEWGSTSGLALSLQLGQCLAGWLSTRRLPAVGPLPDFTLDDLRSAGDRLAKIDAMFHQGTELSQLSGGLGSPPPRLAIPFLRVLSELARDDARMLDGAILRLDPTHPVARRNRYVTALVNGDTERRSILPLLDDAPMYAKPHLSVWGDAFDGDRRHEGMGIRHQGIAASLMPANPYACHNYSLQLADQDRREESYRWADRATVATPQFGAAHLDCVRRLRQVGRPGQAFAEAQYRYREILDRSAAGKLVGTDWQASHHAALLIAFAHLDVGRITEAIELADEVMRQLPDDPAIADSFAWARKRVSHWKTDAGLLARAFAWEGHHRGDPGRVIAGLTRGRITDDEDAAMLIEALLATGRFDQAEVAYWHCAGVDGTGVLGDSKARMASAKALIAMGDLDEALDQIQIVQLRRGQSRLEAETNRVLRLAATRPAVEWERVIERRLARGAARLAQLAARDLADFVPGLDTPVIRRALGESTPLTIDPIWITELIAAAPAAQPTSAAILQRLAPPEEATLRAADALSQEWWTALVPPARDRDAHAAGALLAFGVALANYLVTASGPPSPLAGAYRHVATEALHLVRRSRYQIEAPAIQALLRIVNALGDAPEWLLDTWVLRIERALDLEAEHGAYLDDLTEGLPLVQRLLRGDERIGWELRLAHDLASDPSQYEPAAMLFARCQRAVEGGSVELAWSTAAVEGAPEAAQLDVHWLAALANPTAAAPWLRVAHGLFASGRPSEGFDAACRGMTLATATERGPAFAALASRWKAASLATPIDGEAAFEAGLQAATEGQLEVAVRHLRWAAAVEPGNAKRAQSLAVALGRTGHPMEAVRALAPHERTDAPRLIGRVLHDAGRDLEAVTLLRYASRRFRAADDWVTLCVAASRADNDAVTVEAGRRALALGANDPAMMVELATSLYRIGEFVECEQLARQLISEGRARDVRLAGLHAMARALAGQGRHVDAHPYAKAAAELGPNGKLAAELIETMDRIVAQQDPPVRPSADLTMERRACADLEAGKFDELAPATSSPSWGITRVALVACEFRTEDESGIPVSPRALDAAVTMLGRTEGTTLLEATLGRIGALRIRDNAFIQIDPPPPMGQRFSTEEFERAYSERSRRPNRPSAIMSFAR